MISNVKTNRQSPKGESTDDTTQGQYVLDRVYLYLRGTGLDANKMLKLTLKAMQQTADPTSVTCTIAVVQKLLKSIEKASFSKTGKSLQDWPAIHYTSMPFQSFQDLSDNTHRKKS